MSSHDTLRTYETRFFQNIVRTMNGSAETSAMVIAGLAVPYDKWTRILPKSGERFMERIQRGAMEDTLSDGHEVHILLDHNEDLLLGSTRTGLRLIDKPDGLHYEFTVDSGSELGKRAFDEVQSGLIQKCSIAFKPVVERWDDNWYGADIRSRTLTKTKLVEISLVSNPAYSSTSAKAIASFGQRSNGIETAHSRSTGREFAALCREH